MNNSKNGSSEIGSSDGDRVRRRAYQLWLDEGCQPDRETEYWLRAKLLEEGEQEISSDRKEGFPASDPPVCSGGRSSKL